MSSCLTSERSAAGIRRIRTSATILSDDQRGTRPVLPGISLCDEPHTAKFFSIALSAALPCGPDTAKRRRPSGLTRGRPARRSCRLTGPGAGFGQAWVAGLVDAAHALRRNDQRIRVLLRPTSPDRRSRILRAADPVGFDFFHAASAQRAGIRRRAAIRSTGHAAVSATPDAWLNNAAAAASRITGTEPRSTVCGKASTDFPDDRARRRSRRRRTGARRRVSSASGRVLGW